MNECCANLKELLSVPCYSLTIMWGEAHMLFVQTNLSTLKIITLLLLKRKTTARKLLILLTRKQFILPYHLTDN